MENTKYILKEVGSNIQLLISQDVKDFLEVFSTEVIFSPPPKIYIFNGRKFTIESLGA